MRDAAKQVLVMILHAGPTRNRRLFLTYISDAGSSPTRTVARPGFAWPFAVITATATCTSSQTIFASDLPSIKMAVIIFVPYPAIALVMRAGDSHAAPLRQAK